MGSSSTLGGWTEREVEALRRLTRLLSLRRGAQSWNFGETDAGDPQLYLLASDPDESCVACVSRVRSEYVLEDGKGGLLATEGNLDDLVARAAEVFPLRRRIPLSTRAFLAVCAWRAFMDQKMAALEETLEVLGRVVPPLAALA